jgi:hypothetical protein
MESEQEQEMLESFKNSQRQNDMADVLKELFDENKIYLIGDLSKDEIKLATRIYMISKIKNIPIWQEGLAFYCKILISKDRKSRKEILEAIKGYSSQKGLLQRLNPMNWGR